MKFYNIDNALEKAVNAADKPVRLKVETEINRHFESIFEQDIIKANFYCLKEAAGGVSARGEMLLDNLHGFYSYANVRVGTQVNVSFSIEEGLPLFQAVCFLC